MATSSEHYKQIYSREMDTEAEWLRFAAGYKANSVDVLTRGLGRPLRSICEFGCGTGAVLERCMEKCLTANWSAIDNSAEALSYLQGRVGPEVHVECLDLCALPGGPKVEIGILSHVLEHMDNPIGLLSSLLGRCEYLVAEVPLENQPIPRAMAALRLKVRGVKREDNRAGHIQFFDKTTFRKLLADAGWKILQEHSYLPYQKDALLFRARRHNLSRVRALLPYYGYQFLGPAALAVANIHFAVLAVPEHN